MNNNLLVSREQLEKTLEQTFALIERYKLNSFDTEI